MTRETKIGLLVGLAFIIVIGILLSDHLTNSAEPPQASLGVVGNSVRSGVAAPGTSSTPTPVVVTIPPAVSPTQAVPTREELATPRPAPSVQEIQVGPAATPDKPVVVTQVSGNAPVVLPSGPSAEVVSENAADIPLALQHAARQNGEELVRPREYKAEAGDNLSRMAARQMGANTRANREAIVKLNPSLQADPNKIVVGRVYLIPVSAAAQPSVVATPAVAAPETSASAETETWYTVKAGDTLWKIATQQCGSAGALNALRELNRDVLKGSDSLQLNMKLRLPAKPAAVASAQ